MRATTMLRVSPARRAPTGVAAKSKKGVCPRSTPKKGSVPDLHEPDAYCDLLNPERGELIRLVFVDEWFDNLLQAAFDDLVEFVKG